MTTLYVVTLYPYDDASEARYQFDDRAEAQAFADMVNAMPFVDRREIVDNRPTYEAEVWESGTYANAAEAMAQLRNWIEEDEE